LVQNGIHGTNVCVAPRSRLDYQGVRTVVDDGGEQVVRPVQPDVNGEQEAHKDLVGEDNDCLQHMEAIACKGCGHS
jgi:hypothetical protein